MYNALGVSVQGGQATVETAAQFQPFFPGLIILLPLIGFLINGALALRHAQVSASAVRLGGELDLDEGGHLPATHTLPSYVAPHRHRRFSGWPQIAGPTAKFAETRSGYVGRLRI